MTTDVRIGECDACHARFKVPASFRADRARCRECGGVVVLERTHPVPRPPLEKSRKSNSVNRSHARGEQTMDERSAPSSPRTDAHESQRTSEPAPAHGTAVAPSAASHPLVDAKPVVVKHAGKTDRAATAKEPKKAGGVLGSIVAAAKAAMWRKKRGDAGSSD